MFVCLLFCNPFLSHPSFWGGEGRGGKKWVRHRRYCLQRLLKQIWVRCEDNVCWQSLLCLFFPSSPLPEWRECKKRNYRRASRNSVENAAVFQLTVGTIALIAICSPHNRHIYSCVITSSLISLRYKMEGEKKNNRWGIGQCRLTVMVIIRQRNAVMVINEGIGHKLIFTPL